jgi:hypothetical protein
LLRFLSKKVRSGRYNEDMSHLNDFIPAVFDDPVVQLLLRGDAESVHEAEEMYLDAALPEIFQLLRSPLTNEELGSHPLLQLVLAHGSRGWEDSIL